MHAMLPLKQQGLVAFIKFNFVPQNIFVFRYMWVYDKCNPYISKLGIKQFSKKAVIKILKIKDKDKRFIKNWRPISLLNKDMKIISKALPTRIKNTLLFLISSIQTAYVKNRFISKSGRVISDILEISNTLALERFLVTVDIKKAFDSVNYCFLLQIL